MDEIAMWLGYGVMVCAGWALILFGFVLLWHATCGAAVGVIRSVRAIKAARKGVKRG